MDAQRQEACELTGKIAKINGKNGMDVALALVCAYEAGRLAGRDERRRRPVRVITRPATETK